MKGGGVLLLGALLTIVSTASVQPAATDENTINSSILLRRLIRAVPRRYRYRTNFNVKTGVERRNDEALCNVDSGANVTRNRDTLAGSKGLSYSEDAAGQKSLICKSKAFKISNKGGHLKRVSSGGTAAMSSSVDLSRFLGASATDSKRLEVGSSGMSAIGSKAHRKEISSAIQSQGEGADAASLSKSREVKNIMQTMHHAAGRTDMRGRKSHGLQAVSQEETEIVKNPRTHKHGVLTQMTHKKKTDFEFDV